MLTPIRDTREKEKNGYFWEENEWCSGYITKKLDTGDYSLEGFEDKLTIERKATSAELAQNIYEKRFDRVLQRMQKYKWAFIVCEFSLGDILSFPVGSGIPNNRWESLKTTGKFILKRITEYQIKYGANFLFCGNKENAWQMVNSIFKRVSECKIQK